MWLKLILASIFISTVSAKAVPELDFDLDSALCENRLSAFAVTDNGDVSASPSRQISNVTEEECMEICNNNRDSDGRLVICASFTYDHVILKCSIYKRKTGPDGTPEKMAAPGKRYFEKFCLDENTPKQCAGAQFTRIDDSILTGYAKNTSIHSTLAGCINQCLKEEFVCKSAMYFYEEGECITNIESGQSAPEDFGSPDDGDKVVYFSNGCISADSGKNETDADVSVEKSKEEKTAEEKEKPVDKEKSEKPTTEKPVTEEEKTTQEQKTQKSETESSESTTSEVIETTTAKSVESKEAKDEEEEAKVAANRLYGAKQLSRAENGTITVDEDVLEKAIEKSAEKKKESSVEKKEADKKETESKESKEEKEDSEATTIKAEVKDNSTEIQTVKSEAEPKEINAEEKDKKPKEEKKSMFKVDDDTESTEAIEDESDETVEKEEEEEATTINVLKANPFKVAANKNLQIQKLLSATQQPKEEDSYFGKWSDWTECTQPGQRKIRRRKCLNLRKCKGALMQVDWCPKILPKVDDESAETVKTQDGPVGPTRNPLPVAQDSSEGGSPPGILPPQLPQKVLEPLPEGAPGHPDDVWSPWLGVCQQFASNQPCKNNEAIGFESRECIAKDPKACKGPFFRYCTLPC